MATAKVGTDQRRLRRSATIAGVGDGVVAVALPLLAANLTHDPLAVAAVIAAQHLPWALVHVGWRFLRWDRRTLIGSVDTGRALILGMIGFLSLIGRETILGIQLAAFVVGLGEALTDGTETETGDVIGLSTRGMVGLAVVGLPLGGVLYEIYPATPFLFEVLAFAVAALLALLVRRPVVPPHVAADEIPPPPRALIPGTGAVTVSAALAAIATSAVLGVLVLFALEDLGLGAPAFGALLAGLALATAAGGFVAPEVGTALGLKPGLAVAAAVAAAGYATASQVADPDKPLAGAVALGVAAGAGMIVAVLTRALLQRNAGRAVTGPVLQRFHLAVWSAIPVGALAGGWLARRTSVHEVLLWSTVAWAGAAIAALLAHPAEKSSEFV
ncbi:MAG: Antibiotic efflux protein [Actinomycetia bacterium]|nr:Antibiotic efflux protein [Actinomycetes bacterium]